MSSLSFSSAMLYTDSALQILCLWRCSSGALIDMLCPYKNTWTISMMDIQFPWRDGYAYSFLDVMDIQFTWRDGYTYSSLDVMDIQFPWRDGFTVSLTWWIYSFLDVMDLQFPWRDGYSFREDVAIPVAYIKVPLLYLYRRYSQCPADIL